MALASAFFAAMHNGVRLASTELHPFEIAFFRSLFGLIALTPLLIHRSSHIYHTKSFGLHFLRGIFNGASILCWFTALSLLPVAEATSLSLAGPLFVILGAMVILGEKIVPWQWLGIVVIFVGGAIIIRPGYSSIGLGTWLVIASAILLTGSKLLAKVVARYDHPDTVVAYLTTMMLLATLVPAISVWKWPSVEEYGLLALIGAAGTIGHLFLARSYRHSDVSVIDPLLFMRMIWAALFGWILFSEFPDLSTWVGAAVILLGIVLISRQRLI